jgi:hypothetical protein
MTPPLEPGRLNDVVVTNPGGAGATLPKGFFTEFLDLPGASPFHDAVERIVRAAISSGCGGGKYCPAASVTRAQMAVLLLRAKHGGGYRPPPATGAVFTDVSAGAFAAAYIERLAAEGITAGCGGGAFCPGAPVRREQVAVLVLKAEHGAGYTPPQPRGLFADVPVSSPFASWIERLAAEGITAGCGAGLYCPSRPTTRAEMASFLVEAFALP